MSSFKNNYYNFASLLCFVPLFSWCACQQNLYEILRVSPTSSTHEIKKAFRELARKYHPDKNSGDANSLELYMKIKEAYEILVDPQRRSAYDLETLTLNPSATFSCVENNDASYTTTYATQDTVNQKSRTTPKPTARVTPAAFVIELFSAVQENNSAKLIDLLTRGYSPAVRHPITHDTLLDIAIRTGKTKLVNILLAHQAPLNELNIFKNTPLHVAVVFSRLEIVQELLKQGAWVNQPNGFGDTPLIKAAELKSPLSLALASALLKAGALCDIQNSEGDTALHKAALHNNTKLIQLLLEHKADNTLKNSKNQTPYTVALSNKNKQAAKLLVITPKELESGLSELSWYERMIESLVKTFKTK